MKIEELRVGNLVMYRNVLCKILSIHSPQPMKDKRFSDNAYVDAWCNSVVSFLLSELEPILITEEWLVKFGFKKSLIDNSGLFSHDFKIMVKPDNEFEGFCFPYTIGKRSSSYAPIKYVHQLQNLYFALTGEELYLKT